MHKKQILDGKFSFCFSRIILISIYRQGPHGTYRFSAPEVNMVSFEGTSHSTYKADVWSIGAILYWLNYGDAPQYNRHGSCHRPPPGVAPCQDQNLVDVLRHTL